MEGYRYRLKLGKSAETMILMDFGRFPCFSRLKKGLSETNFPHRFSALLPSFNLAPFLLAQVKQVLLVIG